ncbi:PD-(D/E)XK motif protein, partial [Salmonella enterica subsp. enterica serovar Typhi]|nr:PD-(D/E)XK motif protein [Salmonella enterica subsp. enterica serovar Typhi]
DNPTYSIREYNLFKVSHGFPRIIENDLIEGVGDVKYSVMISQCKQYLVPENAVLNMIGDVDSNG